MRAVALLVVLLPVAAVAQTNDEEADEGTYSVYSSDEARVELPDGYVATDVEAEGRRPVSEQQELFDAFWTELNPYGRWVEDPTWGWVWYPREIDFRPYASGWWVYTSEGWTFETDAPYGWAVYHYGRWAYLTGGWAWIPGYEWSPAWVSIRMTDGYIGWAPLGPAGLTYGYWPTGWGYAYSPWLFVAIPEFGRYRGHPHHYCDHARGQSAFDAGRPPPSRGSRGATRGIPNFHRAEPIKVVDSGAPVNTGKPSGPVVVYRPKPSLGAPTVEGNGGLGGSTRASRRSQNEYPTPPRPQPAPRYEGAPSTPPRAPSAPFYGARAPTAPPVAPSGIAGARAHDFGRPAAPPPARVAPSAPSRPSFDRPSMDRPSYGAGRPQVPHVQGAPPPNAPPPQAVPQRGQPSRGGAAATPHSRGHER